MQNAFKVLILTLTPIFLYSATIDETSGPTEGGTLISILAGTGESFGLSPTVTFGEFDAVINSASSSFISVDLPPGVGSDLPVTVSWSGGSITTTNLFSYEAPDLDDISPDIYFTRGGELATITGFNFGTETLGKAQVIVGNNEAEVVSQDHTEITFRMPIGVGENQNVRVRVGGQNSNSLTIDYRPPSIWKIEPQEISGTAGDTVYIYGVNFGNGYVLPDVKLGGVSFQEVVYAGDDKLYAITGFSPPQDLNVTVEVGGQVSSAYLLKNKKPIISNVIESTWQIFGGESITLFAKNIGLNPGNVSLELDRSPIQIESFNQNQIDFISIPGIGLDLPLKVAVNGVESDPFFINYEQSAISSIVSSSSSTIGGGTVTISGNGIAGGNSLPSVFIGSNICSSVSKVNDNQLTCILPPGVGQVGVYLDLNGEASNTVPFTYNAPQIFNVNPVLIPLSGGECVITGLDLGNSIDDVKVIADGLELNPHAVNFGAVTVHLPGGFGSNKDIKVVVGGNSSNSLTYNYVPPVINNISPSNGSPGDVLTIQGNNLGGTTILPTVTIDGNNAGILQVSDSEIRCIVPAGSGMDKEVNVAVGNSSDTFIGFSYDNPPPNEAQNVEVIGRLKVTDLPFSTSSGVLLSVDENGNLVKNTNPQFYVSPTNDTLFLGGQQFIIIPGISKANGGI